MYISVSVSSRLYAKMQTNRILSLSWAKAEETCNNEDEQLQRNIWLVSGKKKGENRRENKPNLMVHKLSLEFFSR